MTISDHLQAFEAAFGAWRGTHYRGDDRLQTACRYALEGEGKRARPMLVALIARMLGARGDAWIAPALAVEMIHTYSLVHDDLPCMDDDAMRRGRPTTHVVFDEATALLVGDALLTDAFTVLSEPHVTAAIAPDYGSIPAARRLAMITRLARAAGSQGMVRGQILDMHWTAREGATRQDLDRIHINKTGRLIAAACALGALSATEDENRIELAWRFGEKIGLAFQVTDDLLDDTSSMGKSQGKDAAQGKLTYLTLLSRAEAEACAHEATSQAEILLKPFGSGAQAVFDYTRSLLQRQR